VMISAGIEYLGISGYAYRYASRIRSRVQAGTVAFKKSLLMPDGREVRVKAVTPDSNAEAEEAAAGLGRKFLYSTYSKYR